MFKELVGRIMKGLLWRARRYIRRMDEEAARESQQKHNYEQDDYSYAWLNSIFTKLLSEEPAALRPNYLWGVLHGVHLAKGLGINRVSVIEFGVAGGNGLISLARIGEKLEPILGVGIDVYGFDTGAGLPTPDDYRDLPNLYTESGYKMDVGTLKQRLKKAQLILGLVETTVPRFIASRPAPVAFVSVDLDYYSSTMQAFRLFEADHGILLPRIHCYFDDIMGFTFSEYNGERLAIANFNVAHQMRKISPIYGLRYFLPPRYFHAQWAEQFYMVHIFDHKQYGMKDGLVRSAHVRRLETVNPRTSEVASL